MSKTLKIKGLDGKLTSYGLHCGYVQKAQCGSICVELWKEHNVYHVRAYDFSPSSRIAWETFDRSMLKEARKCYRKMVKKHIRKKSWTGSVSGDNDNLTDGRDPHSRILEALPG